MSDLPYTQQPEIGIFDVVIVGAGTAG
ncbi:MAG: hypothetical protein RLZ51_470, partial [Pseudomonadota bacterium]